jgi:hypothetical protein
MRGDYVFERMYVCLRTYMCEMVTMKVVPRPDHPVRNANISHLHLCVRKPILVRTYLLVTLALANVKVCWNKMMMCCNTGTYLHGQISRYMQSQMRSKNRKLGTKGPKDSSETRACISQHPQTTSQAH